MRVHSDLRPYKCNFCAYSSKQSGNIRVHLRRKHPEMIHETPTMVGNNKPRSILTLAGGPPKTPNKINNCKKPFQCLDCDEKFARLDSLKSHTSFHHKQHILAETMGPAAVPIMECATIQTIAVNTVTEAVPGAPTVTVAAEAQAALGSVQVRKYFNS